MSDFGWVRVDPTGVVSPDRIQNGSLDSLYATDGYLRSSPFSLLRLRDWQWINGIRLQLDALNYRWQSGVMSYQSREQYRFLTSLLGDISASRILLLFTTAGLLTLLPFLLFGLFQYVRKVRKKRHQALRNIERRLSRIGIRRRPGETMRRAVDRAKPGSTKDVDDLAEALRIFEASDYGKSG